MIYEFFCNYFIIIITFVINLDEDTHFLLLTS